MKQGWKSYLAHLKATGKPCLLGGVRETWSSRFAALEQAQDWLRQGIEANREAGRPADGYVHGSKLPAEIS